MNPINTGRTTMTEPDKVSDGKTLDVIDESVSQVLAAETGRPASEFQATDYAYPDPDDLESVPEDER